MILKAVVLLLIPVSLAVEQESSYPLWQPLLGLLETCQSKNYQLQEKLSEVQSQLYEVNLDSQKKDVELQSLKAQIAQQAALITQLKDQASDLKQTCELGKLKDLFSEEIAKLREVVKSGSGTEPNEAEKNATIAESGELAKNEAANTTQSKSTQVDLPDRCPSTQDTWRVYREIQFPGLEPFQVTCYAYKRVGYGWMEVFFKNHYSTELNQTYDQYINGFGDVEEEHFIGLEKLHILTSQKPHEMYLYSGNNNGFYEVLCRNFVVGDRSEGYSLKRLDGCSGDTSHFNLIQGTKFSTFDRNQDGNPDHNWSRDYGNGFWFNAGKPIFEKGAFIHFLIRR